MNTLKFSERTSLLREIVTAFLIVAGMSLVGMSVADEPVASDYSGMAVECYVDLSDYVLTEYDKGKIRTYVSGVVTVWRIVSEDPPEDNIMNGWEYTDDEAWLNKAGRGTVNGDLEMYPDEAHDGYGYVGRFVEIYSFKNTKSPSGMYTGEGDLLNTTVTYETKPVELDSDEANIICTESELPAHLCCFPPFQDCEEEEYACSDPPLKRKAYLMNGTIIDSYMQ